MKKNNKGFSLVELIVVVLIMGIIAVALAPQVIKWVENSRKAADASAYDELIEEIQVALVDRAAYGEVKGGGTAKVGTGYKFHVYSDKLVVEKGEYTVVSENVTAPSTYTALTATQIGTDSLTKAIAAIDPKWDTVKGKASDCKSSTGSANTTDHYIITVERDGTVNRTTPPTPATDY